MVLVAGGIGITPFVSLLNDLCASHLPTTSAVDPAREHVTTIPLDQMPTAAAGEEALPVATDTQTQPPLPLHGLQNTKAGSLADGAAVVVAAGDDPVETATYAPTHKRLTVKVPASERQNLDASEDLAVAAGVGDEESTGTGCCSSVCLSF